MKPNTYTRSTVECRLADLRPGFIQSLKPYAEEHQIKDVESEVLYCFETTNQKKGFFGKIKTSYFNIIIAKTFLFWNHLKDGNDTGMAGAKWSDIAEITDWETSEMNKIEPDHGVEIYGFIHAWSHRSKWFIGLGADTNGDHCRKLLRERIEKK